jgi:hypothetical protein
MPRKIKLLVAGHLALGIAPVAMFLGADLRWMPVTWAAGGISFGQVILLAFWAGLGTSNATTRLLGTLAGTLYLAVWPAVGIAISEYTQDSAIAVFAMYAVFFAAMLVMFWGVFLLVRRRFAVLRRFDDPSILTVGRFQFSILNVLLVTSIVAVVLGAMRLGAGEDSTAWRPLAGGLLAIGVEIANIVIVPWATLARGPVLWRSMLALAVALASGTAVSFTNVYKLPFAEWRMWIFSTQALAFTVPPLVVLISLLVIRSCGYRLVPLEQPRHVG